MPRRNRSTRVRNGQRSQEWHDDERPMTYEDMARNLIERGLASSAILSRSLKAGVSQSLAQTDPSPSG
jgi:hypothetical protein